MTRSRRRAIAARSAHQPWYPRACVQVGGHLAGGLCDGPWVGGARLDS